MAKKRTFTAYEITQAFRLVRESIAVEYDLNYANGENFSVRDIEFRLMDILQPAKQSTPERATKDLKKLTDVSLDEFNDALFG